MAAAMDWRTDQILTQHQSIPAAWADGDLPAVGSCANCADFSLLQLDFNGFGETRRFQAEPDSLDSNRRLPALPKAGTPQWVAAQKLRTIFSKKPGCPAPSRSPHRANRSPFAGSQRSATYRCDRKMVAIQRDKQSFHIILKSPFGTRLGCACQWHDRLESLP
jgi:hypothetical protein